MALSETFLMNSPVFSPDSVCKMQLIDTKIAFSLLAKLEVWSHKIIIIIIISRSNLIQLKLLLVDHFGLAKEAFLQEEINS